MVLRHVTVELTEKQYETLCRMTANAGMPVADVIQAFAEELPGNSALDGWLKQHQRKNFLSYLAQKEKARTCVLTLGFDGGRYKIRTCDPIRVKDMLYP